MCNSRFKKEARQWMEQHPNDFHQDADMLDSIMRHYTGLGGAHFGFIANAQGQRQFFVGGRVDLIGQGITEALVNTVQMTPGLDASFIDLVADSARGILQESKSGPKLS